MDWHLAFGGTAVLGLITIAALPQGDPRTRPDVRRELKVLARPEVLLSVLGAGAMSALHTCVAPVLAEITHASPSFVAFALVLIGIGFTLAGWSLEGAAKIILALLAIVTALLPQLMTAHPAQPSVWWPGRGGLWRRAARADAGYAGRELYRSMWGAFNQGNAVGAASLRGVGLPLTSAPAPAASGPAP